MQARDGRVSQYQYGHYLSLIGPLCIIEVKKTVFPEFTTTLKMILYSKGEYASKWRCAQRNRGCS